MERAEDSSRWLLVLVAGAVMGMLAGLGHFLLSPPTYAATAVCVVSPRDETTPLDTLSGIRWAQALSRLATQEQIAVAPLHAAGLVDMGQRPREYISAVAAPDTSVFTVTVRDSQRDLALRGAEVVSAALERFAQRSHIPVRVSTEGAAAGVDAAPTLRTRLILGTASGLGIAMIIVLSLLDVRRWPGQADDTEPAKGDHERM